jgi:hypothetical protein
MLPIRFVAVCFLVVFCFGCSSVRTVSPDSIVNDNSKPLTIILHTGGIIKFNAGDYVVSEGYYTGYVEGTGTRSSGYSGLEHPFKGRIGRQDIKECRVTDQPDISKTLAPYILGGLILLQALIN